MTQGELNADPMAGLRAVYASAEGLPGHLTAELRALAESVQAAAPHWNTVMPEREWTPAEEAEHAVIVAESTAKVVRLLRSDKPLQPMPEVPIELKDGKRVAPPGTLPSGQVKPEDLLTRIEALKPALDVVAQPDPTRTFYHPAMGHLDALDWLRMAAYHTRHHRKAIQRGLKAMP